jgi:dual specificity tyrosine-phosphorylation-regulated kinase 2/3/4
MLERKMPGGIKSPEGPLNDGYDTQTNEYIFEMHDHIGYRFEIVKKVGKGSFGSVSEVNNQVVKCFDHKKKEFVAVKIIRNKKKLHTQGIVEA